MTSKASTLFATTASFGMLAPWLRCPLEGKWCLSCLWCWKGACCGGGDLRNALCLMAELPVSAPHVFVGACSFHARAFSFSFHGLKVVTMQNLGLVGMITIEWPKELAGPFLAKTVSFFALLGHEEDQETQSGTEANSVRREPTGHDMD